MHYKEIKSRKMGIKQHFRISGFGSKIAATNIVFVANAIVWYASILMVLESTIGHVGEETWLKPESQIIIWCIHFAALIFSALIGAKISKRISRMRFLLVWMTLNVASSLTLFGLNYTNPIITASLVILYGVSFGIGMPTCMSNYSDSIPVEKRGRISGLIMLISGIGIFAFAAAPIGSLEIGIALSIWRLSSLVVLLAFRLSVKVDFKKGATSFKHVLGQRSFLAYYIPWVLFSFVNFLVPLQPTAAGETAETTLLIQTVFLGIFAVVGGFLLDTIGRKRIAIAGFVMLGLSAAARGIIPPNIVSITYFSAIFEGTAWGLLLVLFLLTLWGDLSYSFSSDKYYALGVVPFFVSMLIQVTIGEQIAINISNQGQLFSFAAFFLFVAVLPLFYATETLPERLMKERDLKSYAEKALKNAQKEAGKGKQKEDDKTENDNDEKEEEKDSGKKGAEYEEARKIAEKYY